MRYLTIILLCTSAVCLAQENYHNGEYGFAVDIPLNWRVSLENEWSAEIKAKLVELYSGTTLLMLNPLGVKPADIPCIQIQGKIFTGEPTPSQVIQLIKKTGAKHLPEEANYLAKDILGPKLEQYEQIDRFYDYDTSKNLAISKILYRNKNKDICFLSAGAKFIGSHSMIDLSGYYEGDNPEQFWQTFTGVVNSFKFDQGVDGSQKTSRELSQETGKKVFGLAYKICGSFVGMLIILLILKKIFNR